MSSCTSGTRRRKRTRWSDCPSSSATEDRPREEKTRRSRWGSQDEQVYVPPELELEMTPEQREMVVIRMRMQEISQKLLDVGSLIPSDPRDRSPSPVPTYDSQGHRTNTREQRIRDRLLQERAELVEKSSRLNLGLVPADYRKSKLERKIFVPLDKFPDYNFIGLIIGPRGNTQKRMERETGAKIMIRGKGSHKEGKRKDKPQPGEDEALHVFISAESQESLDKACEMVEKLLTPVEESINEHKARQLRELAQINGTLRTDVICRNCGESGHRIYQCPKRSGQDWTPANVRCGICGDRSHPTSDCPTGNRLSAQQTENLKSEYMNFMAEISGDAVDSSSYSATYPSHQLPPSNFNFIYDEPPPPPPE